MKHVDQGSLASKVIQEAMNSGLSWEDAVEAIGIATRVITEGAGESMGRMQAEFTARDKYNRGFRQTADQVFRMPFLCQYKGAKS